MDGKQARKRIGLYGGTFDPVHIGHLIAVEQARQAGEIEKVLLIPAGDPPHKGDEITPAKHRLEMLRLATADNPYLEVDSREVDSKEISYSVRTVLALEKEHPDWSIVFIVGEDSLLSIESWFRWQTLLSHVELLALRRARQTGDGEKKARELTERGYRVRLVGEYVTDISSTAIRAALRKGSSLRYVLPEAVRRYIERERLYV
ncbi:MAG: nicotinate (nicotinamide) nucleotide adenylyltransferase [Ndongobacter sp.]|nr:nicotinate (nicotinamide) nucleotide adenylyltransferase [Ndongobacter sp.]